jgi:hypothetical protein
MLSWFGLLLGLVIFLTRLDTVRNWYRGRYPDIKQVAIDIALIVLFIFSMGITKYSINAMQAKIYKLEGATYQLLTPEQEKVFLDYLRNRQPGTVNVFWLTNHLDVEELAKQIARLLERAGWTAPASSIAESPTPRGLTIRMQSARTTPPYTATLREVLTAVGHEPHIVEDSQSFSKSDQLWLVVGHKPRP